MNVIGEGHVAFFGADDEGPHTPGDSEWWNESVWLHFLDRDTGIHGILRIGHQPNWQGGQSAIWSLIATPTWVYKRDGFAPLKSSDRPSNGFRANGTHSFEYDGKCHWKVEDQDIQADLVYEDYHPPFNYHPDATILSNVARHHIETAGRLSGKILIKGVEYELTNALAYRDHSWGTRYWHELRVHRWTGTNFGPDLSCCAVGWFDHENKIGRFGYVRRGDNIIIARNVDVLAHMEIDGISHRGGTIRYELPSGEDFEITCRPVGRGVISRHHMVALNDNICWANAGGRVGVTCFETNNNLQGGVLLPQQRNLVSAIVEDGVWPAGAGAIA